MFLVRDDGIYEHKVGKWETQSDWNDASDDTFTPLISIPPEVNGIHIADPDSIIQVQFGDNAVVISSSRSTIRQRDVYLGDFTYDKKGKLTSGKVEFHAYLEEKPSDPTWIGGGIYQATDPTYKPFSEWDASTVEIVDHDDPVTGGLPVIRAFGGGKYFYESWHNNLFDTSLV